MAGTLTLRACAAETDEPIEGVSIEYRRSRLDGKNENGTVTTGKGGIATIEYPPSVKTGFFEITARMPNACPSTSSGTTSGAPWNYRRRRSCVSSRGRRSAGSSTTRPVNRSKAPRFASWRGRPSTKGRQICSRSRSSKTDSRGRWRLDVAPRNLGGLALSIDHPRYRRTGGIVSRSLDSSIVLTKGPTVTGRVVDAAGRPVNGARAILGHDTFVPNAPTGTTNDRGEFILENCDRGPSIVTVQAEGFAPRISDVRVDERTAPVEIQLTEPGSLLRGKVVDIEGRPIAGAFFGADSWRGHRSIRFQVNTDKDGRFEWKSAPSDVVIYGTGKFGFMSSRNIPLTAAADEHVITLRPELVITGRVSDAGTGEPLPMFRLIRGHCHGHPVNTYWAENEMVEITGGRFTTRFSEPCDAYFVRVESPGYRPAESCFPVDRGESDVRLCPGALRSNSPGSSCSPTATPPRGRGRARHA